jgi:chromosome segregation ATPase
MDEGFVDLRSAADHGSGGDSFWPSFTDLMMVVLMIFMIASTILMLRNWELVSELRATIDAEREARAQAQSASRTSATLEERLAQAQHEISELRIQLLRANEQNQASSSQLMQARQQLLDMQAGNEALKDRLQQLQADNDRLNSAYTSLQGTMAEMQRVEQERTTELARLRQQSADSEQQLAALQGSYDELSVKYDKLVKPARAATGKYLVSVRYRKEGKLYRLEFKESEQGEYRPLTRKQLDERLSKLKDAHPGQLYVKVVIPEDSGLSYTEAWTFTQDVLTAYDYYYQN